MFIVMNPIISTMTTITERDIRFKKGTVIIGNTSYDLSDKILSAGIFTKDRNGYSKRMKDIIADLWIHIGRMKDKVDVMRNKGQRDRAAFINKKIEAKKVEVRKLEERDQTEIHEEFIDRGNYYLCTPTIERLAKCYSYDPGLRFEDGKIRVDKNVTGYIALNKSNVDILTSIKSKSLLETILDMVYVGNITNTETHLRFEKIIREVDYKPASNPRIFSSMRALLRHFRINDITTEYTDFCDFTEGLQKNTVSVVLASYLVKNRLAVKDENRFIVKRGNSEVHLFSTTNSLISNMSNEFNSFLRDTILISSCGGLVDGYRINKNDIIHSILNETTNVRR